MGVPPKASATIARVLVRLTVLLLLEQAFVHVVHLEGDDNGIGVGLLSFTATILVSALWGAWDGWHDVPARTAVVWVLTGVAFGVLSAALIQVASLGERPVDWSVLADDVRTLTSFSAQLVAVPALLAAGATALAAGSRGTAPA